MVLALAVALGVLVALAFAYSSDTRSARATGSAEPIVMRQVPDTVPSQGANICPSDGVILMPAYDPETETLALRSADAAIEKAPCIFGRPVSAKAVLARLTVGATLPPPGASAKDWATVKDRLVWAVTFTLAEPVDPTAGGPATETPAPLPSTWLKSHFNAFLDAQTGELVWGFFTE